MLIFHWFYKVFRFSMHPARWLIFFAPVANSEAQLRFSRPRGFHFSCVFSNENCISVCCTRPRSDANDIAVSSFPTFSLAKVWILKGNGEARDLWVLSFTLFSQAKVEKGQTVASAEDCKTRVKVRFLSDFLACLVRSESCMFAAGAPCRAHCII